ncbi:MAG: putative collagen-binding domain-containing protein, partial [Bacteroidota bacterium]
MADYFEETDPYNHLRVIHTYPGQKDQVYTPLLGNSSAYTGVSLQTSNPQYNELFGDVTDWVENSASADKKWVVAVDEPGNASIGVDADPDDRKLVRHKVVWATFMGGGSGTEFYYGYQSGCGDLQCQDHRSRDQKYTDAAHALHFFQTHFQQYLPIVVNDDGLTSDNNDYVLAKPDVAYAVYRPDGGSTNINLPPGTWRVQWYNPRNGNLGAASTISGNNLVAPDNNDWTALITLENCSPGAACNDGDDCTANDTFDDNCNCAGNIVDSDNDGICDADDQCPGEDDTLDADNDGIPDACDACDGTLVGTSCDDGDPETSNDVFLADCSCLGQPPAGTGEYWLEAECAEYGNQWTTIDASEVSGGINLASLATEEFLNQPPSGEEYRIRFTVEVAVGGVYAIFGRVLATNDGDDSFWVSANGGFWNKWNRVNFPYNSTDWVWEQVGHWTNGDVSDPVTFTLQTGTNIIDFVHREPNTKLDKILL